MLVLPTLHTYLSQLLSPPSIHTALLLTPEGALVSYASQRSEESSAEATSTHGSQPSPSSSVISGAGGIPSSPSSIKSNEASSSCTPQGSKSGSVASIETRTEPAPQRSKDMIRMAAGLGAEVWAETRGEAEGMVESELGRILVLAVEDGKVSDQDTEPLLLLAVNGTVEADWDTMRIKARKLATFLAPSVNKHRGIMGTTASSSSSSSPLNGSKSRTRNFERVASGDEEQFRKIILTTTTTMSTWSSATSTLRLFRPAFASPRLARHARRQSASAFATPQPTASSHARSSLLSSSKTVDPHALLKAEITHIASYYFHHPSKQLRPLLVLLFSRATNGLGSHFPLKLWSAEHSRLSAEQLDAPLSRPDVLNDFNPSMPDHTASFDSPFDLRPPPTNSYPSPPPSLYAESAVSLPQLAHTLLPTQLRLAQIVEMIHVASLLHDDVIDKSDLRRGAPSAPAAFGNKLAVLGGDFLLGRASAALSRLGESEVVELISSVVANLVEGEILQMKGTSARTAVNLPSGEVDISSLHAQPAHAEVPFPDRWSTYLRKTYLKSASLLAKGARAAVVLGGCREGEVWKEAAYAYGRNVGIAFQLVDDILDFSSSAALGKPGSGADLRLGLATGPVLYAAEEYPELEPLIARGFKHDGDVERALSLIHASSGISRTRDLARAYAEKAREVLGVLPAE
ncbi:isoprenoid synthase domain-containing protein [Lanmaoa asiatica]|nr:isoprenoid synthase domain-containing protein [Lanmaoa asiatica]